LVRVGPLLIQAEEVEVAGLHSKARVEEGVGQSLMAMVAVAAAAVVGQSLRGVEEEGVYYLSKVEVVLAAHLEEAAVERCFGSVAVVLQRVECYEHLEASSEVEVVAKQQRYHGQVAEAGLTHGLGVAVVPTTYVHQ
jgi:hypothetical protein